MNNKDQINIGKILNEMYDRSEEYDWENPYKDDIKKLKKREQDIDVESGRVVRTNSGEWSADPEDFPNQGEYEPSYFPSTEEMLNDPTIIKIIDKLKNDRDFAFVETKLGDMEPPSTWSDDAIAESIVAYSDIDPEMFKQPKKFAKEIYNKAKKYFMRYINYVDPMTRKHREHRYRSGRKKAEKRFGKNPFDI